MENMLPKDSEIAALLPEYTAEGDVTRIVLTNGFIKKTQKTPPQEIEKAKRYRADYLSRRRETK